jgi:hypothetical protein
VRKSTLSDFPEGMTVIIYRGPHRRADPPQPLAEGAELRAQSRGAIATAEMLAEEARESGATAVRSVEPVVPGWVGRRWRCPTCGWLHNHHHFGAM